jgi:hypothetical protein
MKKRLNLLVSGGTMGGAEGRICDSSVCDISWLVSNPTSLIWPDKIILTKKLNKRLEDERNSGETNKYGRSFGKIFEIAKEYNVVEIKDSDDIITETVEQELLKLIDMDIEKLCQFFPKQIQRGTDKEVPNQVLVEGEEYCAGNLSGIYSSLLLAKEWNAELVFSTRANHFLKYKLGTSLNGNELIQRKAFDNIFNTILPEKEIFPYYVMNETYGKYAKNNCNNCTKPEICEKTYLEELENNVRDYMDIREFDEIDQIKNTLREISQKLESTSPIYDQNDIVREFRRTERKLNRDLKTSLPKINRWANLSLVASKPMTLLGLATGNPLVTYTAASFIGISESVKELIEYSKSKYKWVGFMEQRRKKRILDACNDRKKF